MGRDMIRKAVALVLVMAMLVGIMPEVKLFADDDDGEYDPIEGTTYQIPWDPITTNYVARRASARYVGVGPESIFESLGYSSADYANVRSSKYDLISDSEINYLYPQGVVLGANADGSKKTGVAGIATLLNLGSPLVVAGWTWHNKGTDGGAVASGASHPGIMDPLDNEIFSLQRWTEGAVNSASNGWYGTHMLQRLLAATYKRSAWFSLPASAGLSKTFILQSGADYAYQLGKSDGSYDWFMGWAKVNGERRAYTGKNYWDSVKTFINKSYVTLTATRQVNLPGYAQGNSASFTGDTKNGIEANNEQGVENSITAYYMRPVVFATNCEQCFDYYYNKKGLSAKDLITGSRLTSSELVTAGSASNNYTLTVKKCSQCSNPDAHKNGEDCHIWLVPGETEISAQIYENGSTYDAVAHPYSVSITNNSTNSTDRYITWADAVFTVAGGSIPKEVKIDGDNGKYEYDSTKTPSYTDIGSDGKTKAGRNLLYFGAQHYSSSGGADERYQLLVYKHNTTLPDLNLIFYVNGKRTYTIHDSDGKTVTYDLSKYDYHGVEKFTKELWDEFREKGTPLTIAQGDDAIKKLNLPPDAEIRWISCDNNGSPISTDAYTLLYNVSNPDDVILTGDTAGKDNRGKKLYDITATNIVPSKWDDVTVKVNVTIPPSEITINYLNKNDNSKIKDSITFPFIKYESGEIPYNIIAKVDGEDATFTYDSYEFVNTAEDLQADIKVVAPTKNSTEGYAKAKESHNKRAVINVYYYVLPEDGYTLGMEFFIDGIAAADEVEANYLAPMKTSDYKKGNYLEYPEIIEKNGKTYQFSRYSQNGVSTDYVKHDANTRRANVAKDGKKTEKVKAYYKEIEAHTYTVHFVVSEAGKQLDQCGELYATDKKLLAATGTLKTAAVSTTGIDQLSGYELDTSTPPIDIHGTVRNTGSVSGTTSLTYTGGTIQAGYDYDIYIPFKLTAKANVYTIHYTFGGQEMWSEGPYKFNDSDYTGDKASIKIFTGEKEVSGTTYEVDLNNTADRYDRHNYKTKYGTIAGTYYKTGEPLEKGYDYDIYIPLKITVQKAEYVLHYYKGTTNNILYTQELGDIPDSDVGKKKVISWGSTSEAGAAVVSFPMELSNEGYMLNYTGYGYDKHNGIMNNGTLDSGSHTYTTRSGIEKGYRYDIYIPVAIIGQTVTIVYRYVDADNGFKPLIDEGVWVDGIDIEHTETLNAPGQYRLPKNLPEGLSKLGWQYAQGPNYYKRKAWTSTWDGEAYNIAIKRYDELVAGSYAEYSLPGTDEGWIILYDSPEWDSLVVLIPLTRPLQERKVNIHYYVTEELNTGIQGTIYRDTYLRNYSFTGVGTGKQEFDGDMYVTLTEKTAGYESGTILEVSSVKYPHDATPQGPSGIFYDAFRAGSSYAACTECRDYFRNSPWAVPSGTIHHMFSTEIPIPDAGTTWECLKDASGTKKAHFSLNVQYDDRAVDVYVELKPREYVPLTVVYFEDGNPGHVLYTDEVAYDMNPRIHPLGSSEETLISTKRTGGYEEYAYWQEIKNMPEIVMDSTGLFWEPAYMALNKELAKCPYTTFANTVSNPYYGSEYNPYDNAQLHYKYLRKENVHNEFFNYDTVYYYCMCGAEIDYTYTDSYGTYRDLNGHPVLKDSSGNAVYDSNGKLINAAWRQDYSSYQSSVRYFTKWNEIIRDSGGNIVNIYTHGTPSYYSTERGDDQGFDFDVKSHTFYLYYRAGQSTTKTLNYSNNKDDAIRHLEPSIELNDVLYIPCKKTDANTIDVRYVTLDQAGGIDKTVYGEDKVIVVRKGDTGITYSGGTGITGADGRKYTVIGSGQVLSYRDSTGYAPYKEALSDTSNTVGQPVRYTITGKLGTWTGTKPYQSNATTVTNGVIYIPVAPEPDLTVKVRYVVYGEDNTVIREDTLPDGLATGTDIYVTVPSELKHPVTGEKLVPIGTDYDIALYGKETSSFYDVTYKDANGILNGTPKDGYTFEEVLSGGTGKVHFTVPYLGFDKTDAVVYIPYEPSTTKVDVRYITIREDGTWRRTIKTEDEVELERGSSFTYNGTRTLTMDGWTFEVSDDVDPVMSYNGASYDLVRNGPGNLGQRIDYDGFVTWQTTENLYVERATLYIPVHITGGDADEGEEEGTDPTDVPDETEDPGIPGLTMEEAGRTDGLDWGNWCEDPLRPVPDRLSGGLFTGRDSAYAFIYHDIYSVSDAIPSGTNKVRGAINTFPYLAGAKYSTVSKAFNYHIRNTITFTYKYYTASGYDWDWETNDVEDEEGFHTDFEGHITLPVFEEHTDTVTYEFGFDIPGTSEPYVTDIDLSVAYLNGGQITDPALDQALKIGGYTLKKTEAKDGSFTPQALSQYEYSETRSKVFEKPVITAAGGTYTDKDEYEAALAEIKAVIAEVAKQPGAVQTEANKAYADAKVNPAQAAAEAAAAHTNPDHAQLWVDGTNYINASGAIVPLTITRTTYDATNTAAIPKEKENGEHASAFTTDYVYYINELNLKEVDPSGSANTVYVHTPVYTEVTVDCDNLKYDQTKTAGMPSFVLVNGTSDSYGSADNQNISNDFTITVANKGQHLEYPGYGNRDYSGYLMANGNQIAFDCDMWMDVGINGSPADDLLIPAGTWAWVQTGTEADKGRFYLPEWVADGTHSYYVRAVAYNNAKADIPLSGVGAYGQMTANTWRSFDPGETGWATAAYTSYVKGEFTVIGKLYGLTLTDVNDSGSWKNVFRQAGKEPKLYSLLGRDTYSARVALATANTAKDGTGKASTAAFDKSLAYYYRFGTFNELGLGTGRMAWGSLPTLKGYNPVTRTEGTLKAGYTWTFKVDTVGTNTVSDDAVITVEPFFSWISLDGKTRVDNVKLYYSETVDGKKYTLTRVGSQSDLGNVKNSDVGSMLIPADELKNTAKLKGYGVSGGPKLADYLGLEGETFRYGKFTPSANFKTFSNLNYYGDIAGRGIAKVALADGTLAGSGIASTKAYLKQLYGSDAKAEQELSKLRQSYYFTYRIPKEFYVYPSDKTPSTLKDLKAEKMNDSGYLVVSFRIHSVVNGTEYLYYWDGNSNMWNLETGSADGTIKRTDAAGTEFTLKNGDVALVEIVKGGGSDVGTVLK